MPLRSPFAKRSSIRRLGAPVFLVGATCAAAAAGAVGLLLDSLSLSIAGLLAAVAFAGAFAVFLIVSERRRHESAEDRLQSQASFLESLVQSIAVVSSSRRPDEIVERTCAEARRLFHARDVRILPPEETTGREAHEVPGGIRLPLTARGERLGTLELKRPEPFHRLDLMRATVLADFASRAVENARLIDEAVTREGERERLTESLITAEQDERRRLSIFLHDGPLQSMSGIALMHDAALAAIEDGRYEDAAKVIASSLERERDTIRTLRDLSFAIEPLVLRDQGFGAAIQALGQQIEQSYGITVSVDVDIGDRLGEKAQVALYQLIREAINQAMRRKPNRIAVTLSQADSGHFSTEIEDDGVGERRRAGIEDLDERVRVLNGQLSVDSHPDGGTVVRVLLPAYVAATAAASPAPS
ncbi:MAG: histidine kinase [Actinomycetota bacterium]|nr:histidine kinase [Actinomycetota bacterium]